MNEALRLVRIYSDYSQSDMARLLEVSKSYISEVESGKKGVSLQLLERYAEVLGIPLSSLVFFAESIDGEADNISNKNGFRIRVAEKILLMLNAFSPADPERRHEKAGKSLSTN